MINTLSSTFNQGYTLATKLAKNLSFSQAGQLSCKVLGKTVQYYALYNLWDSAISNLLALDNLRHGTNLFSYCSIRLTGLNPARGSQGYGETAFYKQKAATLNTQNESKVAWAKDCVGTCFLVKDTEYKTIEYTSLGSYCGAPTQYKIEKEENNALLQTKIKNYTWKVLVASDYEAKSSNVLISNFLGYSQGFWRMICLIPITFLTPTLKFHFDYFHIQKLKISYQLGGMRDDPSLDDPTAKDTCYQSNIRITPLHLGITGSLIQGLNLNCLGRIKRAPLKPLLGAIQLIFAVGLTCSLLAPPAMMTVPGAVLFTHAFKTSWIAWFALHSIHITTF